MPAAIRTARPEDAETLAVLATEVWLDTYAGAGILPAYTRHNLTRHTPARFLAAIADSASRISVAHQGDAILGFVRLVPGTAPTAATDGSAEVKTLYLRRHHHRQGLGASLLNRARRDAGALGHAAIWLTVNHENAAALAFYDAQGMRRAGIWTFRFEGIAVPNVVFSAPAS